MKRKLGIYGKLRLALCLAASLAQSRGARRAARRRTWPDSLTTELTRGRGPMDSAAEKPCLEGVVCGPSEQVGAPPA
jgi:hypothetical protein